MPLLREIKDLERFTLESDDDKLLGCLTCDKNMEYKGFRTASPWPNDRNLYNVEAYSCSNYNNLIEYWRLRIMIMLDGVKI